MPCLSAGWFGFGDLKKTCFQKSVFTLILRHWREVGEQPCLWSSLKLKLSVKKMRACGWEPGRPLFEVTISIFSVKKYKFSARMTERQIYDSHCIISCMMQHLNQS